MARRDLPVDPDVVPRLDRRSLAAVALGGACGAPARYGVAQLVHVGAHGFPWATFWTNVSGSFVLGLLLVALMARGHRARTLRAFATTGFLGAYTTCSTFAVEADLLLRDHRSGLAFAYVLASVVVGLAAARAGITIGRRAATT